MILNSTPENQAILSNVGEVGEFRIRNSAKAFSILSSGLYANKIKAIIRELSCNAVDSHVAAGKTDVPFEVHLPNALEPHFSIRDFGTGLDHDQVTNIYTTYFESTKTNSNAFIGALGLGSKSPFSYTDNFTVTAVKDGVKGIYSAFINGEGVPSIAKMMDEPTDDPSGVEIKFSVNDRFDFQKFKEEAVSVYKWFKLQPKITGATVTITQEKYETENLIQGVHVRENDRYRSKSSSIALMGNIAYPIDVPNPEQLGDVRRLLECGLVMEFGIGELDFQASREGLSYIPQTIESIKKKLTAVNDQLVTHIAKEADGYANKWDRAIFLSKKVDHPLWLAAVRTYVANTNLETVDVATNRYNFLREFRIKVDELASKYNIAVRGFTRSKGSSNCGSLTHSAEHSRTGGVYATTYYWGFHVSESTEFVINDTNVGVGERAKYHYRNTNDLGTTYQKHVYVLDKLDTSKPMDTAQFFADIQEPPASKRHLASSLMIKPRKDSSVGRNVSILGMEKKRRGYSTDVIVWTDAGKLDSFDKTKTHYYVPLTGYVMVTNTKDGYTDAKELVEHLKSSGMSAFANVTVYGVRKTDLPEVKKLSNWVNIEDHISKTLKVPDQNIILTVALQDSTMNAFAFMGNAYSSTLKVDHSGVRQDSPFKEYVKKYDNFKRVQFSEHAMKSLYSAYGKSINFDMSAAVNAIVSEHVAVRKRYPLLGSIDSGASHGAIAEYVNLIDNLKGI